MEDKLFREGNERVGIINIDDKLNSGASGDVHSSGVTSDCDFLLIALVLFMES